MRAVGARKVSRVAALRGGWTWPVGNFGLFAITYEKACISKNAVLRFFHGGSDRGGSEKAVRPTRGKNMRGKLRRGENRPTWALCRRGGVTSTRDDGGVLGVRLSVTRVTGRRRPLYGWVARRLTIGHAGNLWWVGGEACNYCMPRPVIGHSRRGGIMSTHYLRGAFGRCLSDTAGAGGRRPLTAWLLSIGHAGGLYDLSMGNLPFFKDFL